MDDYYELLGVDDDAPVDDIRTAYREKKAECDGRTDAKAEVAALNKAWNVLSDPYQRGRYDQQREVDDGSESSDDHDDDDDDDSAPVARKKPPRAADRAQARRNAREPLKPTVTLPAGMSFPSSRRRLTAMLIDLSVLLVLVIASLVAANKLDRSMHKPIVANIDRLRDEVSTDQKKVNDLPKTASKAVSDAAKAKLKKDQKDFDDESKKLVPLNTTITAVFFLVGLLYLVIPSAASGQTIGKRTQNLRVIRVDGSPLGWGWSLRRYGLLVLVTFTLLVATPFGALGAALVLFGVTMWMRNPNQQGLHDRLVKTLVVSDDRASE